MLTVLSFKKSPVYLVEILNNYRCLRGIEPKCLLGSSSLGRCILETLQLFRSSTAPFSRVDMKHSVTKPSNFGRKLWFWIKCSTFGVSRHHCLLAPLPWEWRKFTPLTRALFLSLWLKTKQSGAKALFITRARLFILLKWKHIEMQRRMGERSWFPLTPLQALLYTLNSPVNI